MYKHPHFWTSMDVYLVNTNNQLVSWFDDKSNHHEIGIMDSNVIIFDIHKL